MDVKSRRPADHSDSAAENRPIALADLAGWHVPGVHRVLLAGSSVWVRVDSRGIASVSTVGPDALAPAPDLP